VKPEEACKLYDGLHSHLKSVGVDGVKIDVTHVSLYFIELLLLFEAKVYLS
jgi:hypothetical protein